MGVGEEKSITSNTKSHYRKLENIYQIFQHSSAQITVKR